MTARRHGGGLVPRTPAPGHAAASPKAPGRHRHCRCHRRQASIHIKFRATPTAPALSAAGERVPESPPGPRSPFPGGGPHSQAAKADPAPDPAGRAHTPPSPFPQSRALRTSDHHDFTDVGLSGLGEGPTSLKLSLIVKRGRAWARSVPLGHGDRGGGRRQAADSGDSALVLRLRGRSEAAS
jgi:hypothetical protein